MNQTLPITNNVFAGKIIDLSKQLEFILKNNNNRQILVDIKFGEKRKYFLSWLPEQINIYQETDDISNIFIATKDNQYYARNNGGSSIIYLNDFSKWKLTKGDITIPSNTSLMTFENINSENYEKIRNSTSTIIAIGSPDIQKYSDFLRNKTYNIKF